MPHRSPSRRPRSSVLVLTLAVTAAAAGCGSTTSTDAGPTTTTAPGTTAATVATAPGSSPTTATTAATAAPSTASTTTTAKGPGPTGPATSSTSSASTTTTTPGTDPGTLPQTEDKPTASGAQWDEWTHGLWNAIVADDPAQARPFFFPLAAYRQVKAISDIDGDYEHRLIAYYEQDIHKLHQQLGTKAGAATFVKIDVPATAQWIKPGVEYNKGAYWRVFDSKLVYEVDGAQKTMLVKSMISWRGQWYVVHLSSIR